LKIHSADSPVAALPINSMRRNLMMEFLA